ncbi:hypothetical protein DFP72DRAFT_989340 [Ephemerocybe angulata]|uniref:Zn(2)-C6 fungal-type domain-containing protein n=1 Tax=Ephemerocybe angulata TaxID=980116 RepID=A0A8H6I290_9AGAR|nr:hypothetical protein DFP72DRAFT_989340 [Tulosesus angulatus]
MDSYHDHHQAQHQPGLVLPTQSVQNQIHELAKSLPLPRKQNTACDACRSRKVKCNKLPGQDKVPCRLCLQIRHCLSKNFPCTHYVQQATSEKKRGTTVSRRPRNLSSGPHLVTPVVAQLPLNVRFGFHPHITPTTPTKDVLLYLFAPPESTMDGLPFSPNRFKSPYDAWGELASKLEDETFRAEFALDLVEVYFQIVHTRLPLLNPAQFRNGLGLQPPGSRSEESPLHPALVATVLAWGSKFSEHELLVADRKRPSGQSFFAKTLIDRARDLAEALKVHRVPSTDHVVISLLIEPLQSQSPEDQNGYHGFWLTCATRHLLALGINHKTAGTIVFAWWMTCLCDAYASAYYRRKPILDDEDYDIDFYTAGPVSVEGGDTQNPGPSPREQLEVTISEHPMLSLKGYYQAAHSLARTARQISRHLWKPAVDSDGVPFETLLSFSNALNEWRNDYLSAVGVPANYSGTWDFVSAVSSCASDATYHIEAVKRKVADEALHGALRIAGLAGVLTSNGYLRLDPAVMHVSCIQAGTFLARLGRPEVANCIAGLEQYSYSYEEAGDQAREMRKLYEAVSTGENELNHMDSVTPRVSGISQSGPQMDLQQQAQAQNESPTASSHNHVVSSFDGPSSHTNVISQGYSQPSSYSIYGR